MKTFKQWNQEGRRIHAGSKAQAFNEAGEPLFTEDQTYDPTEPFRRVSYFGLPALDHFDEMPH